MLYKICDYTPKSILRSLYFAIFHSHLSYGLPVWGNADRIYMDNIVKLQNKAIRAISFADFNAHTSPLLKETKILSIDDQTQFQISSLMWDLDNDLLPPSLLLLF